MVYLSAFAFRMAIYSSVRAVVAVERIEAFLLYPLKNLRSNGRNAAFAAGFI